MLKIATKEDEELVRSMAYKFVANSPYKEHHHKDAIDDMIHMVLTEDQRKFICLLHGTDGMIVGMANYFPYGDFKMATEFAWWVEEDKRSTGVGKELIDAFEYWAKEIAGCRGITMVSLDDTLGNYYTTRDYVLTERSYLKWLH
jgi:RimJ/RimL family protein N-acetyltransferase